ncbi:MAG: CPBP family intramembrane metalloprotease, partial [Clostridiales bacterium]|nr:CPBP family intramembrane metalloprotease [Clostridiales bacterium]
LYLGAFLVQGMAEEVLCRGYLLSTLMHRLCAETAVVISAIAFMVPHLTALLEDISVLAGIGIINLMMISVIFSMMRLLGGKLWMPGAAHGFWNFSLSVFFGLNVSGISTPHLFGFEAVGSELVTGGAYGIEASLVTTILLGAVLAILIQRYNGQKQRSKISV